jgi:C4-dicarboxylate transporter DctQ subunit
MSFLHYLDRVLAVIERATVVLLLTGLLVLGLLQVVLRNLFAGGLFGAEALLRHLVVWLGFLGASLATRERRHLSMNVLGQALPVWCQPWCTLLTDLAACFVCALLTQAAWRFVQYEHAAGTVLAFGLATWLAQSIMPLGFLLMTLRFALRALATLQHLVHGQSAP